MAESIISDRDSLPQLRELIKITQDVLHDPTVEELAGDEGNGAYAWQLIFTARDLLEEHSNALVTGIADDYYADAILPALSLLLGARDMKETHRALPAMLEPAIAALKQAEHIAPDAPWTAGTPPLTEAGNAAPGGDTQAGEASEEGRPFATVQEIADELWNVRALAKALHDTLDWDKCNSERRVLRVIDERLEAIHKTM